MNVAVRDKLRLFGWNADLEVVLPARYGEGAIAARVLRVSRGMYELQTADRAGAGRLPGAFEYRAAGPEDYPAVGDWVAVEIVDDGSVQFLINGVLPRSTLLSRKSTGVQAEKQVLAANVDIACIVFSLEGGRKATPRGAERYLTLVRESGALPVMLLNKLDLAEDPEGAVAVIAASLPQVEVIPMSCVTEEGVARVRALFSEGRTGVLIGPSGAGKSTLVNLLLGEERFRVGEVRQADKKGVHTTTHRELVALPGGGLLIDTPGLRELQLWAGGDALDESFSDIAAFAGSCRFRDCSHSGEPGCAVQAALAEGAIDHLRFQNYLDLRREIAYLARRTDERARRAERERWKKISKQMRRPHGR